MNKLVLGIVLAALALDLCAASLALAQSSPPLCPAGSWAVRAKSGWTCSKSEPSDTPPPSDDNRPKGHGGHRGGMTPQ